MSKAFYYAAVLFYRISDLPDPKSAPRQKYPDVGFYRLNLKY